MTTGNTNKQWLPMLSKWCEVDSVHPQHFCPGGETARKDMAMGQKPNCAPSEHPNPTTKIGSKMGGALVPLVLNRGHIID